jgi:TonB family protein
MIPVQTLSNSTAWQQWDGRIVNATFPLVQYLGGSEHSAFYLTTAGGAKAAIKLIPADAPYASVQLKSWKLAQQLSHPNLVRVFETGLWHADEEQDMLFAIMEYCEESLARVIRERTLTPDEARNMLEPTLDALKYLHGRGILHGQIKPAHILASGDRLKLSSDTVHRNGESHPSPTVTPYDAPERSGGTISLGGDVWALGVTLFEALNGHLPGAPSEGNSRFAAKLSPPFEEIVTGCLTRDRERRLSISAIRGLLDRPTRTAVAETKSVSQPEVKPVASTLEKLAPSGTRAAAASAPVAPPVVEDHTATKGWSRRPLLLIAAAVLLVLAIGIGLKLTRNNPETAPAPVVAQKTIAKVAPDSAGVDAGHTQHAPLTAASGSVLHQVMPDIAAPARNSISGTVKVRVRVAVAADGKVSRATLAARGPSTYFAKQSLEAARRWSFGAPIRNGVSQPSEWILRFEFRRGGTKVNAQPASRA